jgi:hypothetical protein
MEPNKQPAATKEAIIGKSSNRSKNVKHYDPPELCQRQLESPGNGCSALLRSSLGHSTDHEQPGDRAGGLSGHSSKGLLGKLLGHTSRGRREGLSSPRTGARLLGKRCARRRSDRSGGGGPSRGGVFGRSSREPVEEARHNSIWVGANNTVEQQQQAQKHMAGSSAFAHASQGRAAGALVGRWKHSFTGPLRRRSAEPAQAAVAARQLQPLKPVCLHSLLQ